MGERDRQPSAQTQMLTAASLPFLSGETDTVWIIGDSSVRRGAQRAAETMGRNLSLPGIRVCWFGRVDCGGKHFSSSSEDC
ncbi:hypothetical protein G5714_002683 [Onychostoma macrolepis]|uniref:Uncharacterized protein n=1 Tax=Onychostoma macrolepis TaxID=369639 RepID=A0A7J6D8H7_9TELE|nr:hypothetical protein G5714_002683 [Onychostoma macrolepis]